MKSLSEVLQTTEHLAKPITLSSDSSNMPRPGLITGGGKMSTQLQAQNLQQTQMINTNESLKPPLEDTCEQKTPISKDIEGKKKLTRLITACYEALNIYGKSPEQLEAIIMLMQMTLGRFEYEVVKEAFGEYLQRGSIMPTPADIIKIIEPPIEPRKWCGATFIDIKRRWREGQFISTEEKKYCSDYVNRITDYENKEDLGNALKQIENETREYWAIE